MPQSSADMSSSSSSWSSSITLSSSFSSSLSLGNIARDSRSMAATKFSFGSCLIRISRRSRAKENPFGRFKHSYSSNPNPGKNRVKFHSETRIGNTHGQRSSSETICFLCNHPGAAFFPTSSATQPQRVWKSCFLVTAYSVRVNRHYARETPSFYLRRVKTKDDAFANVGENGLTFKIEYSIDHIAHPLFDGLKEEDSGRRNAGKATVIAYLPDRLAPDLCPGLELRTTSSLSGLHATIRATDPTRQAPRTVLQRVDTVKNNPPPTLQHSRSLPTITLTQQMHPQPLQRTTTMSQPANVNPAAGPSRMPPIAPPSTPINRSISLTSLPVQPAQSTASTPSSTVFPDFQRIIIPRGTFEIQLILDQREIKDRNNRQYIMEGLCGRGVDVERKQLPLGDVLWVAKVTSGPYIGQQIVVDAILERKRLDDLCNSIKDNRFHEQKFRLKSSALARAYYLVEDYDVAKHREQMGVQINTALSSTQVVDHIFVKETKNLEETIDYLCTIHETLCDLYESADIYVIPPNLIKRHTYVSFQEYLRKKYPNIPYMTTYDSFGKLNSKSGGMTVLDCWTRMLLCINGLSAEKVSLIIEAYPTPRKLWEAFKAATAAEDRQRLQEQLAGASVQTGRSKKSQVEPASLLLTRLPGIGTRKKIGPALSKKVYDQFMQLQYDNPV